MPALPREAAWGKDRLLGDLQQSVPQSGRVHLHTADFCRVDKLKPRSGEWREIRFRDPIVAIWGDFQGAGFHSRDSTATQQVIVTLMFRGGAKSFASSFSPFFVKTTCFRQGAKTQFSKNTVFTTLIISFNVKHCISKPMVCQTYGLCAGRLSRKRRNSRK